MNQTEKTISTILSASVRGEKFTSLNLDNINWQSVFEEAEAHSITALIYPTLKDIIQQQSIDKEIQSSWKRTSIFCGIFQVNHIKQMSKVFQSFKEANISVIALKGLVIREYYPHPEFRSMSDSDILVHKEDVERAGQVLVNMGYFKNSSIDIHSTYNHENHLSIDLHWTLVDELHIKTVADFNKTLWENTRTVTMNTLSVLSLSLEYELLHLVLHIASHMIKGGFGLRQLCDIVVFVEKEKDNINWDLFFKKAKAYQIEKLVMTIFIICKELFNMDLPKDDSVQYFERNSAIDFLISEVFSSGVFGHRNSVRIASTRIVHQSNDTSSKSASAYKLIFLFLFPSSKYLDERYSYAKKYSFLIPFAWIHRLFFNLFNNITFIFTLYSTANISKKRLKLLQWLQL